MLVVGSRLGFAFVLAFSIAACGTLIAPYDDAFDQGLNKFSEDTAKFVASASAGGPERAYSSKETTAYYAAAYNLLDRLDARAQMSRAGVPCPANEALYVWTTDKASIPADYEKFDCREVQLYSVRIFVKQIENDHKKDGTLNRSEAKVSGGQLQRATLGAIQTFLITKPSK